MKGFVIIDAFYLFVSVGYKSSVDACKGTIGMTFNGVDVMTSYYGC